MAPQIVQNPYLLLSLQKRFEKGGYVMVAPKSGRVYAYGKDMKEMYEVVKKKNVPGENKVVMHVPSADTVHVY